MKVKPIRQFVKQTRDYLEANPEYAMTFSWPGLFAQAGYWAVNTQSNNYDRWISVHRWLIRTCPGRFAWTGDIFWFEDLQDATRCVVRWL